MSKRLILLLIILFVMKMGLWGDTTIVSDNLNYSAYLPDNWERIEYNDSVHLFKDISKSYNSLVGLIRTSLDTSVFDSAADWSRASFIAYKLFVDNTIEPSAVAFYYDSSKTSIQKDSLWAPELYAEFYSADTELDSWAEYVRFAATDKYGYELFVLGDTLDMATNIGFYAAIIRSIIIEDADTTGITNYPHNKIKSVLLSQQNSPSYYYDPLGRRFKQELLLDNKKSVSSGLLINEKGSKLLLIK